ncbi:MAG: InlB B-repeat-containing protein, partial [bacterium]
SAYTYTTGAITSACTVSVSFAQMTGTLTSPSCTVPVGGSTCSVSLSWGITNPIGTPTAITASLMTNLNVTNTLTSPQSGVQSATVPYGGRTFYLYNNAQLLATAASAASCASETTWNTSTCSLNSYTITFNSNGGSAVSSITADYGASVSSPISPTKTGYSFAGWSPVIPATMPSGGGTFTAQWTPNINTVTLNGNTNTGGSTASQNIATAATANLNANGYTKTGYTFASWNTLANGTGTTYANGASYTIGTASVTLYAQWTVDTYTVTFNGNTNTGGATTTQTLAYSTATPLRANGYTKTGYTFTSWNTLANGTGTTYAEVADYTIGLANVTLYAQWTVGSYTVTFNGNANTGGATATETFVYNIPKALTANGYTKTGYDFAGWATTAVGVVGYANNASYTIGGADVILYAKWTVKSYTVTASAGANGTILPATKQADYGSVATFTITKNAGFEADFGGTCAAGSLSGLTYVTGIITGNCTVSVTFTVSTFIVSTSSNAGGTISPASRIGVTYADNTTFDIAPNSGYYIGSVAGCSGTPNGASFIPITYTTGNIINNCTVTVSFLHMTGTISSSSNSCIIAGGESSCNVDLTWSTTHPIATSAVTANGMTDVNGNSGTSVPFAVPYGSRIFYLYNNSLKLDETPIITSSCAANTEWNGGVCAQIIVGVCGTSFYTCDKGTLTNQFDDTNLWAWQCDPAAAP